jgi:DNA-binding NarL/FixJ family response regulator
VFELILGGLSNREIADRLAISESTVKVHVRSVMQRSSVSSRTQLLSRFLGNRA